MQANVAFNRTSANAASPPVGRPELRRNPEWRRMLVRRVRGEYLDMPGMRLTLVQAQRLFGLRPDICERILMELVREGFLRKTIGQVFARRDPV
jgi:hypothetical protein